VAKAGSQYSANQEIWFNDAVEELASLCGSADDAERLLLEGLKSGRVPWSHLQDGIRVPGDAAFWNYKRAHLVVRRAENRAFYTQLILTDDDMPDGKRGIKVLRSAVLALLPPLEAPPSPPPTEPVGAKWIAVEAKRMKKAKQIPVRITDFARELERRMGKAAETNRAIRPFKWKYIRNQLGNWGLWPASAIK
jgi:hypothetical protein